MRDLVAFDLETTGLSTKADRIIEIGAVRFSLAGEVLGEFDVLVDPGMPIPLAIERLTGISARDVVGAPDPTEAVGQFADFCDGAVLVAHGAAFDVGFCAGLVPQAFAGRSVFDTLELSRIVLPMAGSHSLPLLSGALHLTHGRPHRADSDAWATHELMLHLVGVAAQLPSSTLASLRSVVDPVAGPLREFFHGFVSGPEVTGASAPGSISVEKPPTDGVGSGATTSANAGALTHGDGSGPPARPRTTVSLEAEAARLLGPGGPLSVDSGYEDRPGQVQMARAVAQTIDRRRRLLVEAGTGVGKSLAYLVPVALHAEATGSRAVVATATITLQEQLVHADFPQLVPALGRPPTVALLKGRQNYISLRRWQRFLGRPRATRHGADLERVRFTLKILVWLALTRTGDRAELRLTSSEEALWREIESAADDCLGSGCFNWRDNACHMVRARAHATAADIVITNHALLLADAESEGRVLGPHSVLVIDEAHRLEESATQQWGRSLEAADVAHVTNRLPDLAVGSSAAEAVSVARDAAGRFFGDLKGFVGEHLGADQPANATVGLSEDLRGGYQFVVARRSAELAVAALRGAVACLRADFGNAGAPHGDSAEADGVGAEVELAAVALLSAAETLDRVVLTPVEGHVRWVALRAEQAHVHEAPIEIGDRMRALVERTDASVLTSATLSVGGSFDFVRHRLGLGGNVEELVVASPFDYLAQALTVLPAGIPAHDDPGVDAALLSVVGDIVRRLQGRTLVLFTGYGPLRRLHGALQRSLSGSGIAVLGQGLDGTRRQILASFLANRRSVLLGTNTFWEGIDVPGDALSCVVIAKLPFPVPTDPLVQARTARLRDPFRDHALPIAVLRLRQGFGRLIRRTDDRGAVVLCDPRLASRDYGQAFLDALPPATVTRPPLAMVGEIVEAFVGGGALPRLDV